MLEIDADIFESLTEVYETSSHSVTVLRNDGRFFRVTAERSLKHGGGSEYFANFEERATLPADGTQITLWVDVDLPWAVGDTIEDCLRQALGWINNPG